MPRTVLPPGRVRGQIGDMRVCVLRLAPCHWHLGRAVADWAAAHSGLSTVRGRCVMGAAVPDLISAPEVMCSRPEPCRSLTIRSLARNKRAPSSRPRNVTEASRCDRRRGRSGGARCRITAPPRRGLVARSMVLYDWRVGATGGRGSGSRLCATTSSVLRTTGPRLRPAAAARLGARPLERAVLGACPLVVRKSVPGLCPGAHQGGGASLEPPPGTGLTGLTESVSCFDPGGF
jgi:hypothetical protein